MTTSLLALAAAGMLTPACLSRPIEPIEPRRTSTLVEQYTQGKVDKIDILLAIDDSGSMADKQTILAQAVPDLLGQLVNPACVKDDGTEVAQPALPQDPCPDDSRREFEPVLDIHIGVISTSLGPRGSAMSENDCPDDDAHLLTRSLDEDGQAGEATTYQGLGFLAWDPAKQLQPAGWTDAGQLEKDLADMVRGVGQTGCGYEAQLESWYRFLVDPDPYEEVLREGNKTTLAGTDGDLLEQREDFLRPDSLVAIIMLSDENDCSFSAAGVGFVTAEGNLLHGLQARSECKEDPSDPCCSRCDDTKLPAHCPEEACPETRHPLHDATNLNCFAQKQRFGIDLLYPVERYVTGLTELVVPNRDGELVDNPLFVSERDGETRVRPQENVFLAGIVGVPWQKLARNGASLDSGLKSASELARDGVWDEILGDPKTGVAPTDPHMIETFDQRDQLAPANSVEPYADPINGHEYVIDHDGHGDLQYACIFDLPDPIDCSQSGSHTCDCSGSLDDVALAQKPLCQAADGSYSNVQLRAKAYPSIRQLSVLEGIGDQAVVASICPEVIDPTQNELDHYGYRPAISALTERLKERLHDPCLQRSLSPNAEGQVACVILEGRRLEAGEACSCDGAGRRTINADFEGAAKAAQEQLVSQVQELDCFCEIVQLSGDELDACQNQVGNEVSTPGNDSVDGWCYVDATTAPPIGNEQLVAHCPAVEQRTLRFVGAGQAVNGSTTFLTCQQSSD